MATDLFDKMRRDPAVFRRHLFIRGARGIVRCDAVLADFQRRDFAALDRLMIALRDGNEPTPNRYWLERTKGASKSSDAAIAVLWLALFCPRMLLIQIAAADEDQASEIRRVIKSILKIPANKWLTSYLDVQASKIVNLQTETTIEILTADALGSHGARPDLVVIDEVSHAKVWAFVETLMDNAAKMPCGALLCLTNAGLTTTPAYALREVARQSSRWYFSTHDKPAPWLDAEEIAERKRVSTPSRYKRLWGGIWTTEASDGINPDLIQAAITLPGGHHQALPDLVYVTGVDSAVRRDLCAAVTLAVDQVTRRIRLAEVRAWKPPKGGEIKLVDVENYVRSVIERFQPRKVLVDPSHFWGNIQTLHADGFHQVEATPFTAKLLEEFANCLMSEFSNYRIDLYEDPLIADIGQLELEDLGSRWRVRADRTAAGHADRGFAFCLALAAAVNFLRFGVCDHFAPPIRAIDDSARWGFSRRTERVFRHGIPSRGAMDPDHEGWTNHGHFGNLN